MRAATLARALIDMDTVDDERHTGHLTITPDMR
jgi:hypothetical protein